MMVPLASVPEPLKKIDCPVEMLWLVVGLSIEPFGMAAVGLLEICTNWATDGTPAKFNRNNK